MATKIVSPSVFSVHEYGYGEKPEKPFKVATYNSEIVFGYFQSRKLAEQIVEAINFGIQLAKSGEV